MDVLLLKPNNTSDSIAPNLGLGYLASALRPAHRVILLNGILDRVQGSSLNARLQAFAPHAVGIQVYSSDVSLLDSRCP